MSKISLVRLAIPIAVLVTACCCYADQRAESWLTHQTTVSYEQRAISELRRLAESGDAVAQFTLARRLQIDGKSTADIEAVVHWYSQAVAQNNIPAMLNLAAMYYDGQDIPRDKAKAAKLYERAAGLGNAGAMVTVGNMYFAGDGIQRDPEKARKLILKAAEQGYRYAYASLGHMAMGGSDKSTQNLPEAYAWFSMGSIAGDTFAEKNKQGLLMRMTPKQREEAEKRARAVEKQYYPATKRSTTH